MDKCPSHNVDLIGKPTRFGKRWGCPVGRCTVACWDGSTSTPADYETRQARKRTHEIFDSIWKLKITSRSHAYRNLADYLGINVKKTHIGSFNINLCEKTILFAKTVLEEI